MPTVESLSFIAVFFQVYGLGLIQMQTAVVSIYSAAKCAASSPGAEKKGEWLVSIEITF